MSDSQEAPTSQWCLEQVASPRAARAAEAIVNLLKNHEVPESGWESRWRAAAMLSDSEALLQAMPRFTFDRQLLPGPLQSYSVFQEGVREALNSAQVRARAAAGTKPPHGVYGPWQGGRQPDQGLPRPNVAPTCTHLRIAALNMRGGLGAHGGLKHRHQRLLALIAQLQAENVHIAVLSEPRLGPGFTWPANLGYTFLGERSTLPDTVAVILDDRCLPVVSQVADVGSSRALWLSISSKSGGPPLLVLAAYGLHKLNAPTARVSFWQERVQEFQTLRLQASYQNSRLVLLGDLNTHMPGLVAANHQYCGATEQAIHQLITSPGGLSLTVCNPAGAPTLDAGTALDVVAAAPALKVHVTVQPCEERTVPSDHLHLFATVDMQIPLYARQQDPIIQWARGAKWDDATQPVLPALLFIGAWATLASRWAAVREQLRNNKWGGLRQWLVDIVAWWRAVALTLAGHVAGLVLLHKSGVKPKKRISPVLDWLHDPRAHNLSSVELRVREEMCLSNDLQNRTQRLIAKHARLWCIDRALADRLLSATLKPRQGLVLALTGSCGRELPQARAISVITQDLLSRAAAKGHGTTAMNEAINAEVHAARAQALIEASVLKEDPVTWLEVAEAIKHMPSNKASVRLPRAVARVQAYPVTLLTWALCCLIAVTSKLPCIWMREVSPVDKTGSGVIRLTKQIRPITCVDDIETILDTIWLGQVRPQLEQFMGFEQSGGRFDHIVVVIGVVLLLQARKAQQLPSLLQVADLQQGYESVWRQALRCLTRRARLKGWHWLLLDAWLGNETLRVRVGGAVGMAVSILHHSIGQGKVSGTHLFGTFATALTRTWQQHCCGLGITVDPAANLARHLCRHGAPGLQPAVHDHNAPWLDKWVKHLMPMSDVARLEEVESTAPCRFPYQQYVDDAIIPALHAPALAKANKAISGRLRLMAA